MNNNTGSYSAMKKSIENKNIIVFLIIFIYSNCSILLANDWDRIVNLNKHWRFSIGDDLNWASPSFSDEDWRTIKVPSKWEDQGYNGHDGFAWYRTNFTINSMHKDENLYLNIGYIDDVDEVYVNGILIGFSGVLPPNYWTAYNAKRVYTLPKNVINFNEMNTIAVRVYDSQLGGGIVSGDIGIYRNSSNTIPEIDLSGIWKFRIGDDLNWRKKDLDQESWADVMVPGFWRYYGFADYDGFGWYRKEFYFDKKADERYVLVLGKIDDLDEVFINGRLVGATGNMENKSIKGTEYALFRAYYLNEYDLKENEYNLIAIRVYDGRQDGGIYEGPIGIMSSSTFKNLSKGLDSKEKERIFWNIFFN